MAGRERVGAMWIRKSQKGTKYISIQIGDKRYVAFMNSNKSTTKSPDWIVYEQDQQNQPVRKQEEEKPTIEISEDEL
mgnify:CR=1 FL=1